jgi:hypothetical protein
MEETEMKERPILLSGPTVRAILEERQTQMRRIVKGIALDWLAPDMFTPEFTANPDNSLSPYGYAGDRLWVRETWGLDAYTGDLQFSIKYRAGGDSYVTERNGSDEWVPIYQRYIDGCGLDDKWDRWRPSIHMPRWASRITLEVTGVRAERLQDISEDDAKAEGVEPLARQIGTDYRGAFQNLWDSINKDRTPWDSNPWVWVVEFRRVEE